MSTRKSPTTDLLALFVLVFLVQQVSVYVGVGSGWFALAAPLARPWSVVTSIYAHAGLKHLLANVIALAFVGFPLERFTSRFRFHAFVLVVGVLAGLAQYYTGALLGQPTAVLGASGAILGLYGYVIAGNRLTGGLVARLGIGRQTKLFLLLAIAVGVTLLTAAPGVALVAHFTGFAIGLLAGRYSVL